MSAQPEVKASQDYTKDITIDAKDVVVIATSGKVGSGKDFIAHKFIIPMLPMGTPYVVVSFADSFKIDAIVKRGVKREEVFEKKTPASRKMLQEEGTEKGRNVYGEDIWIRWVNEQIHLYAKRGIRCVIITDVRFPNEVEYIDVMNGYVFRIVAPQRTREKMESEGMVGSHISETALDNYDWNDSNHFIVENDPEYEDMVPERMGQLMEKIPFPTDMGRRVRINLRDIVTPVSMRKVAQELETCLDIYDHGSDAANTSWMTQHSFLTDKEYALYKNCVLGNLQIDRDFCDRYPYAVIVSPLPPILTYVFLYKNKIDMRVEYI
jgi:hypothetical protein